MSPESSSTLLVKESLASILREKIVSGLIKPGEVIVEGKWATQLRVAQGSVREALNILASEGFVQKIPGRRAKVTKLTREDVQQIYQMRSSLEGLAARLLVKRRADFSSVEEAWANMQRASAEGNVQELVNADLRFHLALCEQSGNRFLFQYARRLLSPLFACALTRVCANQRGSEPWLNSFKLHGRILDSLRLGDPLIAEQFVIRATDTFAALAYDDWEGVGGR